MADSVLDNEKSLLSELCYCRGRPVRRILRRLTPKIAPWKSFYVQRQNCEVGYKKSRCELFMNLGRGAINSVIFEQVHEQCFRETRGSRQVFQRSCGGT